MNALLRDDELAALEAAVGAALVRADAGSLRVLGYGEISLVAAWPAAAGTLACKRLPLFDSERALASYRDCVDRYLAALREGGVEPVPTAVQHLAHDDGKLAAYVVQPVLSAEALLPARWAAGDQALVIRDFERILAAVDGCVGPSRGLDGQLSNWAWVDGALRYLDVSTPMLRDAHGREALDTGLFLASLPWALRSLVRRFMLHAILDKYYDRRGVVLDLLGNLYKERLGPLVAPLLPVANAHLAPPITGDETMSYYRSDARMWALLQRLRRLDRWWQRRVRRHVYPFLLPGDIERHLA
ncbi:MAG: hypothetical protein JXR83_20600 [Deltaproteobacteria bacterium]|nr:hypothetical protein [Deltaproteobacteria bacterium]